MKKRKIALITLLFVIAALIFFKVDVSIRYDMTLADYIRYNSDLTDREEAVIREKPINVGVYDDPPLAFTNEFNNYNSGIAVDYISQLAIETRSNVNLKVRPEKAIMSALYGSDVDVIILENNQENSKLVDMSIPLCVLKTKVLVPVNSGIKNLQHLDGKKLVTLANDNIDGRISSFFDGPMDIEVVEVENMYQCFALLRNKAVEGFVGDDMEVAHFLNATNRGNSYEFLEMTLDEKEMSLAVRKGSEDLLSILNKGILDLKKKNLIAQTQYKWLGDFETDSLDLRNIEIAYNVLLGIFIIVGALSSWNYVITQRVNTKTRELSESKEELRLIIDTMKNGLMVVENESNIVECNDSLEKMLGLQREDIIGKPYQIINALEPFVDINNMNSVVNIGKSYYYITKQRVASNKSMIVIEDYTEKYINERQARQESKMVAVGQLSAGLAHEIRNPLGLIKSYSYIIEKHRINDICDHAIYVINDSVDRVNKLIENLLRFSKLSNDEIKRISIKKVIDGIIEEERRKIESEDVEINSSYGEDLDGEAAINEEVLRMVVQNLIKNAVDSFSGFESKIKSIDLSAEYLEDKLHMKITDNGCGIEKEKLDKIFDPFFSTKDSGTGLGLYIVSTEVENNNGKISVESEIGKGTSFDIVLPIVR